MEGQQVVLVWHVHLIWRNIITLPRHKGKLLNETYLNMFYCKFLSINCQWEITCHWLKAELFSKFYFREEITMLFESWARFPTWPPPLPWGQTLLTNTVAPFLISIIVRCESAPGPIVADPCTTVITTAFVDEWEPAAVAICYPLSAWTWEIILPCFIQSHITVHFDIYLQLKIIHQKSMF